MRPKKSRKSSRKILGDPKKKLRIKTFYIPNPFYKKEGKKNTWRELCKEEKAKRLTDEPEEDRP